MAPHAAVHEDSFAPYLVATDILWQGTLFPRPWAPESGYGLYYTLLPAFLGADSVVELFRNTFVLASLVSPLAYVGLRWGPLSPGAQETPVGGRSTAVAEARCAGLIAGAWLAFSPELADTLLHGARTYHASLWTAMVTAGVLLALAGRSVGTWLVLLGLPMAMMNHPYSAAFLLPAAILLPRLVAAVGVRWFVAAVIAGLLLAMPRVLDLWHTTVAASSDVGTRVEAIARSNQADPITPAVVLYNLKRAYPVSLTAPGLIHVWMLIAPLLLLIPSPWQTAQITPRWRRDSLLFALYTVLALLSFGGLALLIYHLDPYHFRVLLPATATAGAWGLVRLLRWLPLTRLGLRVAGIVLPLVGILVGLAYAQPDYFRKDARLLPGYPTAASTVHAVAQGIQADCGDRPRRIGGINVGESHRFYVPAVPIDMILGGVSRDLFPVDASEDAVLYITVGLPRTEVGFVEPMLRAPLGGTTILETPDPPAGMTDPSIPLYVIRFDDLAAAQRWSDAFCEAIPDENLVSFWWDTDYLPFVGS